MGGDEGVAVRLGGKQTAVGRLKQMTHAAHYGTRAALAEKLEEPLARRTPLQRDTLRSVFGALFLFWSARRVLRALRALSAASVRPRDGRRALVFLHHKPRS